jgi:LPXTG-motif cell wall-anchored protein
MPLPHLVRSWRTFVTCMLTAAATALALALALPATAAPTHNTSGTAATVGDPGQPQPQSTADTNSGGANGQCPDGPYCSTRGEGTGQAQPSGNGNQTQGKHAGEPCAGCVGKADNKNPKGQMPNGSDHNAGYECDRNHGIGRTNPAHTGCTSAPTSTPSTPSTPPTTDCTTNPAAEGCQQNNGGGGDCTTNPTAEGCQQNSGGPENNPAPGCTPTALNHFCADVLGEEFTNNPTTPPVSPKAPSVLGERLVMTPNGPNATNTPNALPHTGAQLASLLLTGAAALVVGSVLLASARRRRRT